MLAFGALDLGNLEIGGLNNSLGPPFEGDAAIVGLGYRGRALSDGG